MIDKELWIRAGYEMFATGGEAALKVEALARKVGISKSSFYHHFADLSVFMEKLLDHHLVQSAVVAEKEKAAQTIDPGLISILVEHRIDLLFNRQLRFNQDNGLYFQTLQRSNQIIGSGFIDVWVNDRKPKISRPQLLGLFELAMENFFLQISLENLHEQWLSGYFRNLDRIIRSFE